VLEGLGLESDDIFVDLGSGRGRLVLGAALLPLGSAAACASTVGVELDRKRHAIAMRAAEMLGPTARPCTLRNEDMLTTALDDATYAFSNNAVFGPTVNAALAKSLNPTRAPVLRAVATTAPLPSEQAAGAGLSLQRISVMPVNWCSAGHTLYRYGRAPPKSGTVAVDDAASKLFALMRAEVCAECHGNSQDVGLMRIAAFAQEMNNEVQVWQDLYAEAAARK